MITLIWPLDILFANASSFNFTLFFTSTCIYILFELLPGNLTAITVQNPINKLENQSVGRDIEANINDFKNFSNSAINRTPDNPIITSIVNFLILISNIFLYPLSYVYSLLHPSTNTSQNPNSTPQTSSIPQDPTNDPFFNRNVPTISIKNSSLLTVVVPGVFAIIITLFINSIPFFPRAFNYIRIYFIQEIFYDFWYQVFLKSILLTGFLVIAFSILAFVRYIFNVFRQLAGVDFDTAKWGLYLLQIFIAFNLTKWADSKSCSFDTKAFIQSYFYP